MLPGNADPLRTNTRLRAVFRVKQSDALQSWLIAANRTGLPEISRFCDGLLRDAKALTDAVTLPWSNG